MFQPLGSTLNYIQDFIVKNDLVNLYQALITQYQTARNNPADEASVKLFQETRSKIESIHSFVNLDFFSAPKIKILEKTKANHIIGQAGIEKIGVAFSQFSGDNVISALTTIKTETEQLLARVQQTITSLDLNNDQEIEKDSNTIVELTISDQAYDNFWNMGERSESWKLILNLFTRVSRENFDDIKIVSIASGSNLSVLMSGAKTALGFVIKGAKAVAELKKLKDLFFKDKNELIGKYGLKKETVALVVGEREVRFNDEYLEKKTLFALNIVREFRGDKKDDGENENELATAVGMGIERMVLESENGANVLDPKEIKAIEAPAPESLTIARQEERKLSEEVKKMIIDEQQKLFDEQKEEMRKELEAQMKEAGFKDLNKKDESHQEKLTLDATKTDDKDKSAPEVKRKP